MSRVPDGLPFLSRGRHRSPRRGACVMEYTSLMAGESWSDGPACTLPALAHLARTVNDLTDDQTRQQLVHVVPDLVNALGIRGEQARLGQRLARRACLAALPVATGLRRRTLCAALLGAEMACGPGVRRRDDDREAVRDLLRDPDDAMLLAIRLQTKAPKPLRYSKVGVTRSLELAVQTIAGSGDPRSGELLRDLLVDCVGLVKGVRVAQEAASTPQPERQRA